MAKDFLNIILKDKKEEVEGLKKQVPEIQLKQKAEKIQKPRGFFQAMASPGPSGVNIIAEIKRASPSKGVIRKDLDPALYALAYENGGASAISVLTDMKHFMGKSDDLKEVKKVTALPVLRKEFIISSYQIYESIVLGADAVLLIIRILSQQQAKDYIDLCRGLNIDALVEVHSEEDLEIASRAGAKLIGINNRNLSSFDTDIKNAPRLATRLEPDQVAVAASGIQNKEDIIKMKDHGIHNFLIGESLVRAKNPLDFLQTLLKDG